PCCTLVTLSSSLSIFSQRVLLSLLCPPFLFNDTPPTHIYTLSLHDALPISPGSPPPRTGRSPPPPPGVQSRRWPPWPRRWSWTRSEEHTSELQSRFDLVCRLLLEKKKKQQTHST